MNKRLSIVLCFAAFLTLVGCKKEEDEKPIPFFDVNLVITPYPADGNSNISFQTELYLAFSKKIDFEYTNFSPSYLYKIVIDSSWVCSTENQIVQTTKWYSINKDTLKLKLVEGLIANKGYQMRLKYHIEVKKQNSKVYEVLLQDGQPYHASFESSFNTSREYNFSIDTSNVEYAYPWPYQYHFLRNETTRGVVKMKANQENDLYFKNATFKVRFSSQTGQSWLSNAYYNPSERKYIFTIPSDNLENQKIYKIEYIMVNSSSKRETVFLTYHFRTSKFNTFEEKINSADNFYDGNFFVGQGIAKLYKFFDLQESFDKVEGKEYIGLIRFEVIADPMNPWMVDFFKFYDGLKLHSNRYPSKPTYDGRARNQLVEVPPLNAITLWQDKLSSKLTPQQIINDLALETSSKSQLIVNYFSYYYICDWLYIRSLMSVYQNNLDEWEKYFYFRELDGLDMGMKYYFKIKYVAGDQVTYTSTNWSIHY